MSGYSDIPFSPLLVSLNGAATFIPPHPPSGPPPPMALPFKMLLE